MTPNFSFRSFFEKSDATENEKTKKKNAFQKFMAFEPESVTKDEEEDDMEDFEENHPNGCSPNLKRLEKLFREEAELKDNGEEEVEEKKKKGGFGGGGGFSLFQFGTDRYGENPADYLFDDLGGFVPPRGAKWVSTSAEEVQDSGGGEGGEKKSEKTEKSTIETVLERTKGTNASKKLPGGIVLRAPSNVIMAKDEKGRTLPVLPEKMDDETLMRTTHSRDPSEIPEDVLLALEEEAKEEAQKTTMMKKEGGEVETAQKLGAPTPTPTPTSTPIKKEGGSSNFRKKQDLKKVSGVTIPSSMWEIVEFNRAMIRVMTMLMKELKPLGVEGMTIFDPIAGIMLWREQRAEARLKKTSKQYLYGDDEDEMHDEALFFDNNNNNANAVVTLALTISPSEETEKYRWKLWKN